MQQYHLPYVNVDVMTIFALNKCGKGVDKDGNTNNVLSDGEKVTITLSNIKLQEKES